MKELFRPPIETKNKEKTGQIWSERNFENAEIINGNSGKIVLATDIGMRDENQDRIFLDTERDAFAVIDGMGGYAHGSIAAQILAEEIRQSIAEEVPPLEMQNRAAKRMRESGIREGGAVYIAGQIQGKKLNIWGAGDSQIFVVDQKGNIKFKSEITALENVPRGVNYGGKVTLKSTRLMNYDRIIATSDGLTGNVDLADAFSDIKDLPIDQALEELKRLAFEGMTEHLDINTYKGIGANKDNLSILIYEILPVPARNK